MDVLLYLARSLDGSENNLSQQIKYGSALALIILAVLAMFPLFNVSGASTPTKFCVIPLCEEGTADIRFNVGDPTQKFFTVTFPTAFTKVPNVGILNASQAVTHLDFPYFFQAPGGTVSWPAMPVALTEIYGASSNRLVEELFTNAQPTCGLFVNVVNPGSVNAVFRVQFSSDLSTWQNFFPNTAVSDVSINTAGLQSSTDGFDTPNGLSSPFLRVVGVGGNGLTSPSFGIIELLCQQDTAFVTAGAEATTKTSFQISVTLLLPPENGQDIFITWLAHI